MPPRSCFSCRTECWYWSSRCPRWLFHLITDYMSEYFILYKSFGEWVWHFHCFRRCSHEVVRVRFGVYRFDSFINSRNYSVLKNIRQKCICFYEIGMKYEILLMIPVLNPGFVCFFFHYTITINSLLENKDIKHTFH